MRGQERTDALAADVLAMGTVGAGAAGSVKGVGNSADDHGVERGRNEVHGREKIMAAFGVSWQTAQNKACLISVLTQPHHWNALCSPVTRTTTK